MTTAMAAAGNGPGAATAARIVWIAWLALAGICAIALAIQLSTGSTWIRGAYGFPGFTTIFAVAYGTVGAIVVSRRPSNRVGRVLFTAGLMAALQSLYTEYGIVANLVAPGRLPLGLVTAWMFAWAWMPFVILAGPVLLSIFPDGHLLSRRWAIGPGLAALAGTAFAILGAFRIGPLDNFQSVDNPFGVIPTVIVNGLAQPVIAVLTVGLLVSVVSLVVRYRRSDGERRHQLKWIAGAAVLLGLAAPVGFNLGEAGQVTFIVALSCVPIAAGVAVLRYRLYEIDTIINRALVYGLLTAVIAGIYTASIGVMQRLSRAVTGGDSEATIVVTTVLIVSAFTPIKTRLQTLVDRRFKEAGDPRAKLDAFTRSLRERTWPLDRRQVVRRLAAVVVDALAVPAAQVVLEHGSTRIEASSSLPEEHGRASATSEANTWSASASAGDRRLIVRLSLAERPLTERDRTAIADTVAIVAAELEA